MDVRSKKTTTNKIKQKQTCIYRHQISGYQRGRGLGGGMDEMGEGTQMYGD